MSNILTESTNEILFYVIYFGYKISNLKEKQQMRQSAYKKELNKNEKEIMVPSEGGT